MSIKILHLYLNSKNVKTLLMYYISKVKMSFKNHYFGVRHPPINMSGYATGWGSRGYPFDTNKFYAKKIYEKKKFTLSKFFYSRICSFPIYWLTRYVLNCSLTTYFSLVKKLYYYFIFVLKYYLYKRVKIFMFQLSFKILLSFFANLLSRPYSHETFLHTILRYCNKNIFWFQSIDFYWTTKVSSSQNTTQVMLYFYNSLTWFGAGSEKDLAWFRVVIQV